MKVLLKAIRSTSVLVLILLLTSFSRNDEMRKPDAILFMLNHSINMIESMKVRGMSEEKIQDVKDMDNEINTSIMNDFVNNFTYCPVYFFYNDQRDFVKAKEWDKVDFINPKTFQKGLSPDLSKIKNYLIAEVNYPPATVYDTILDRNKNRAGDWPYPNYPEYEPVVKTRENGILLYNPDFQLVKSKIQYTGCSLLRKGNILKPKSLKYNFRGAKKFEFRMKKFFT